MYSDNKYYSVMFHLDSLTRIEMFVSTFEYIVVYGSETALQLERSLRVLAENLPKNHS